MPWKRFLFVRLPLALAGLAALAEGAAWGLEGVAPRRHDLDRLTAALDVARVDAPVVLAGDSVTQDVMKSYRIASPREVANLTTNQASGLIGTAFLLRRYVERNGAPAHVVIASTPEFFAYQPEGAAARTYVTSVFRRDDERAELKRLGIGGGTEAGPAVLSLEQRVGEKLTGLAGGVAAELPAGDAEPAVLPEEPGPVAADVAPQIARRAAHGLGLSPSARTAFATICGLAAGHGFTLHILRAPVPESVLAARGDDDAQRALLREATAACPSVAFDDVNARRSFPDHAFRDADHLRRPGWTAVYARLLADFVAPLKASPSPDKTS